MDLLEAAPESAEPSLRALTVVGRAARNGLDRPQRAWIEAVSAIALGTDESLDAAASISPAELAMAIGDPAEARQLIRFMVVTSLADGPPSLDQIALMSAFSEALAVDEPAIGVVAHLARGHVLRFRLAFARRSHVRVYLRNTRRILGGIRPTIKAILVARGIASENHVLSSRFRSMETWPEDTLGHLFYHHCVDANLPFSGEKGGFPVGALFHDFSHLLAGYDTSPEGEIKNAAFQAGFTRGETDFFTMLFAIVIHSAGINLTPFEMPIQLGRIGEGDLALETLLALQRGAALDVDLGDEWNFWDDVERPIESVRERLGVPPLDPTPGHA